MSEAPATMTVQPLTLQDVFNKGWQRFVIEKGKPSYFIRAVQVTRNITSNQVKCAYRSPDGSCCIIGLCIPDADYQPEFDAAPDSDVATILGKSEHLNLLLGGIEYDHLDELQAVHDEPAQSYSVHKDLDKFHIDIEQCLRTFAADHALTIPGED